MASLMENFMDILEKENGEYERLTELSRQKRQVIIDGNIPALEEITDQEQEIAGILINLEKKREEIVNDMSIVLSKDPGELTVTNMIAFLSKQPKEQQKLRDLKDRLHQAGPFRQLRRCGGVNTSRFSNRVQRIEKIPPVYRQKETLVC